ncbi:MAG: hypothetical protein ACOCNC_11405, partial [Acetivibrio ethanolgignens]
MIYNLHIPDIEKESINDAEYAKKIMNYLHMLNEQIKYSFLNVDDEIQENRNGIARIMKSASGSSEIRQLADKIVLKVDSNGNLVLVELGKDPENGSILNLKADNINLSGYVTIQDLAGDGTTQINGKNITTGS